MAASRPASILWRRIADLHAAMAVCLADAAIPVWDATVSNGATGQAIAPFRCTQMMFDRR